MSSQGFIRTDLEALGFKKQNRVKSVYDVNFTVGGPVVREKMWFVGSLRRWAATKYVGNTFTSTGDQAIDDGRLGDATLRLTVQTSQRDKLSLQYGRHFNWRGRRDGVQRAAADRAGLCV